MNAKKIPKLEDIVEKVKQVHREISENSISSIDDIDEEVKYIAEGISDLQIYQSTDVLKVMREEIVPVFKKGDVETVKIKDLELHYKVLGTKMAIFMDRSEQNEEYVIQAFYKRLKGSLLTITKILKSIDSDRNFQDNDAATYSITHKDATHYSFIRLWKNSYFNEIVSDIRKKDPWMFDSDLNNTTSAQKYGKIEQFSTLREMIDSYKSIIDKDDKKQAINMLVKDRKLLHYLFKDKYDPEIDLKPKNKKKEYDRRIKDGIAEMVESNINEMLAKRLFLSFSSLYEDRYERMNQDACKLFTSLLLDIKGEKIIDMSYRGFRAKNHAYTLNSQTVLLKHPTVQKEIYLTVHQDPHKSSEHMAKNFHDDVVNKDNYKDLKFIRDDPRFRTLNEIVLEENERTKERDIQINKRPYQVLLKDIDGNNFEAILSYKDVHIDININREYETKISNDKGEEEIKINLMTESEILEVIDELIKPVILKMDKKKYELSERAIAQGLVNAYMPTRHDYKNKIYVERIARKKKGDPVKDLVTKNHRFLMPYPEIEPEIKGDDYTGEFAKKNGYWSLQTIMINEDKDNEQSFELHVKSPMMWWKQKHDPLMGRESYKEGPEETFGQFVKESVDGIKSGNNSASLYHDFFKRLKEYTGKKHLDFIDGQIEEFNKTYDLENKVFKINNIARVFSKYHEQINANRKKSNSIKKFLKESFENLYKDQKYRDYITEDPEHFSTLIHGVFTQKFWRPEEKENAQRYISEKVFLRFKESINNVIKKDDIDNQDKYIALENYVNKFNRYYKQMSPDRSLIIKLQNMAVEFYRESMN